MAEKLNKFEKTRLVSTRALEIAEGDKPKVKKTGKLTQDYVKIAEEELEKGKIEFEYYGKDDFNRLLSLLTKGLTI